jgi:hypothetical protein
MMYKTIAITMGLALVLIAGISAVPVIPRKAYASGTSGSGGGGSGGNGTGA